MLSELRRRKKINKPVYEDTVVVLTTREGKSKTITREGKKKGLIVEGVGPNHWAFLEILANGNAYFGLLEEIVVGKTSRDPRVISVLGKLEYRQLEERAKNYLEERVYGYTSELLTKYLNENLELLRREGIDTSIYNRTELRRYIMKNTLKDLQRKGRPVIPGMEHASDDKQKFHLLYLMRKFSGRKFLKDRQYRGKYYQIS